MEYRQFGQLDWRVSVLGFGCARFPTVDNKPYGPDIDAPEATRMLHYAIDHGVNYVDTASIYHGGNSEVVVGQALAAGYRQKVKLATKSPCWLFHESDDFDKTLNEQLHKLQTNHIDFYLMHGLNAKSWRTVHDLELLPRAERAIADGRIGRLGFSFHDSYEAFQQIVDGYDKWTFCQIVYNFLDVEKEAGVRGLRYAASKGLAVVVMEPVQGGQIAQPPPAISDVWESVPRKRTPVALALQWVWDHPEVSVALSGMSSMQQVQENVAGADASHIRPLSGDEISLIDRVRGCHRSLSG